MIKRIALVQMDVAIGEVAANIKKVDTLVRQAAALHPDIIVLPETWNTGFYAGRELSSWADEKGRATTDLLGGLAAEFEVNIVGGSVADKRDGAVFNTCYVFDREGHVVSMYDKVHCFTPAKEEKYFTAGANMQHFFLDGIPCSGAICYDLRFPEWIRSEMLQGVDLFFLPAQWPVQRLMHWDILCKARAIENQSFFIAVNGCGTIGSTQLAGNSMVIDPWGEECLRLDGTEQVAVVDVDLSILGGIREKINVFNDRKAQHYFQR